MLWCLPNSIFNLLNFLTFLVSDLIPFGGIHSQSCVFLANSTLVVLLPLIKILIYTKRRLTALKKISTRISESVRLGTVK